MPSDETLGLVGWGGGGALFFWIGGISFWQHSQGGGTDLSFGRRFFAVANQGSSFGAESVHGSRKELGESFLPTPRFPLKKEPAKKQLRGLFIRGQHLVWGLWIGIGQHSLLNQQILHVPSACIWKMDGSYILFVWGAWEDRDFPQKKSWGCRTPVRAQLWFPPGAVQNGALGLIRPKTRCSNQRSA